MAKSAQTMTPAGMLKRPAEGRSLLCPKCRRNPLFLEAADPWGARVYCVCGYSRDLPFGWERFISEDGELKLEDLAPEAEQ